MSIRQQPSRAIIGRSLHRRMVVLECGHEMPAIPTKGLRRLCAHCPPVASIIVRDRAPLLISSAITAILAHAAGRFGVSVDELRSRRRTRTLALARQVAMYVVREQTHASYPEIGRVFDQADHTSAMHGVKRIARLVADRDAEVVTAVDWVRRAIEVCDAAE